MRIKNTELYLHTTLVNLVSKEKKSIISGPFGSNIGKIFFRDKGIPVIRGNNLSSGEVKFKDDGFVFITREKANELNCYAIINDLIFTAVGTIGQVGIISENLKYNEYVISNKQLRVRFDTTKILPLFAYYWFSSYWIQKLIIQRNVGSTVPLINLSVLKGLPITLPKSLKLQNNIVNLLENLYSKIELNNRINAELERMAKTIYDYWFVQFDFPISAEYAASVGQPELEGKPYKSSGGEMLWSDEFKREIPEGWGNGCFGDYAKLKGGFAFKSSWWTEVGLPVIKIKDINENYTLSLENCSCVSEDKFVIAKNYEVHPGDVVIALTGATVGKYGIVTKSEKQVLVNQRVGFFKLNEKPLEKLPFLINSLNQEYFRKTVFVLASGAAQPNISTDQIDEIPLIIPKNEMVKNYNEICKPFYEVIIKNQTENQKLTELRDWLLPMLMNGQVKVGDVEDEEMMGMAAEPVGKYKVGGK